MRGYKHGFMGDDEDYRRLRSDKRDSGSVLAGLMQEAGGRMPEDEAYNDLMASIDDLMEEDPDTAGQLSDLIKATDALYDANPKAARKVKDTLAMVLEYLDMRSDESEIEED